MSDRMLNQAMQRKLNRGSAVDISGFAREGDYYIVPADKYRDGLDFCDAKRERWVWSIGRRESDGVILASLVSDLYDNDAFNCLWLR
jgi:hypothetical protein